MLVAFPSYLHIFCDDFSMFYNVSVILLYLKKSILFLSLSGIILFNLFVSLFLSAHAISL